MFISNTVRFDQSLWLCDVHVLSISKKPHLFYYNKIRQRFTDAQNAYKVFNNTKHECPEKSYNSKVYGG